MAYKGALIGLGQVAEKAHLPAFLRRPEFSVAAVADASPARLDAAKRLLPEVRCYDSLEALLAREKGLDFVDLATPPFLHARQASLALSAGLHVLCEKPLALSPLELAQIQASAKPGQVVFTVHNWKHAPILAKTQALIDERAIGPVSHAEWHVLRREPAATALDNWRSDRRRAGGGILVDHGWHALYLLHGWLGDGLRRLSARLAPPENEKEATVFLEFDAASALLHLSWNALERKNWGVVYGLEGKLEIDDDALVLNGKERFEFPEKLSLGSAHSEWFEASLLDFAQELAGRGRGRNLAEARFCVDALSRAYGDREVQLA